MQTLTAGSFLNLENAGSVEALKFTARRLAEHTTTVIAENLTAEALKNWQTTLAKGGIRRARNRAAQIARNLRRKLRRAVPRAKARNSERGNRKP